MESDLSETVKQQGLYLLSLLPEDGETRPLHSDVLGRMLPSRKKVYKVLIPEFVTRGDSYSTASQTSKPWSYAKKPTEFTWHEITNTNLLGKLTHWKSDKQKNDLKAQGHCAGTEWMIKSLDRVSAGFVAEELLAKKGILMPEIKYSVAPDTGRMWNSYAGLPALIRLNLLLDIGDVADIDMAKSQIAVLSKLWMRDADERKRLQAFILDGSVYSRMKSAMKMDHENIARWNANPKHKDSQITTTKQLLNKALMGFQGSDWNSFKQMERDFPVMMRSIAAYKWMVTKAEGQKKALSRFAKKLQTGEALIMANVAEKCEPLDIPCVPIFDGMLVPICQAETVKGFFTETLLERLDFAPEPTIETAGDDVYPDLCVNL